MKKVKRLINSACLSMSPSMRLFRIGILSALFGLTLCLALRGEARQAPVSFQHLSVKQGLSHNSVYAILRDSQGFMWFGTYVGLCKYDGYEFTVYKHDPDIPGSLSNNAVTALYEDTAGNLWVGTAGGGLNRFDRTTEKFTPYTHAPLNLQSLSPGPVSAMLEDRCGRFWVATEGGGLIGLTGRQNNLSAINMIPEILAV